MENVESNAAFVFENVFLRKKNSETKKIIFKVFYYIFQSEKKHKVNAYLHQVHQTTKRTKINKCIISHAAINETKILNGQA